MRPMTRRICEELAAEHGAAAVTPALIREAEAEAETEAAATPLPWTPEAEARLVSRLGKAPAMMADFVLRLFQRDVEVEARRAGLDRITEEVVDQLWRAAPEAPVRWAPEAWARLQTAPEFVREGIRKAAERRARRMGVAEITSPLLTRFRNQAMMKAVKRIRELGFTELTFDAFDAAKAEIRTVSLNPEAQERLDRIRRYFETERHGQSGDFLGEDLMRRFRAHSGTRPRRRSTRATRAPAREGLPRPRRGRRLEHRRPGRRAAVAARRPDGADPRHAGGGVRQGRRRQELGHREPRRRARRSAGSRSACWTRI